MKFDVRLAERRDCAAICQLNQDALGYPYPMDKTALRLLSVLQNQQVALFVAERDDTVVGYIHAADYECTYVDPLVNILAVAVDRRARRSGVGRALLAQVERWAKARRAAGVRLVSSSFRKDAHEFYSACDYQMRKEYKNFIKLFDTP